MCDLKSNTAKKRKRKSSRTELVAFSKIPYSLTEKLIFEPPLPIECFKYLQLKFPEDFERLVFQCFDKTKIYSVNFDPFRSADKELDFVFKTLCETSLFPTDVISILTSYVDPRASCETCLTRLATNCNLCARADHRPSEKDHICFLATRWSEFSCASCERLHAKCPGCDVYYGDLKIAKKCELCSMPVHWGCKGCRNSDNNSSDSNQWHISSESDKVVCPCCSSGGLRQCSSCLNLNIISEFEGFLCTECDEFFHDTCVEECTISYFQMECVECRKGKCSVDRWNTMCRPCYKQQSPKCLECNESACFEMEEDDVFQCSQCEEIFHEECSQSRRIRKNPESCFFCTRGSCWDHEQTSVVCEDCWKAEEFENNPRRKHVY